MREQDRRKKWAQSGKGEKEKGDARMTREERKKTGQRRGAKEGCWELSVAKRRKMEHSK